MFTIKNDALKRKMFMQSLVELQYDIDNGIVNNIDEESLRTESLEETNTNRSTMNTTSASKRSKYLIGNYDEQYLLWAVTSYAKFTDGVINAGVLHEL